jgi:leucyl aminopeptidase
MITISFSDVAVPRSGALVLILFEGAKLGEFGSKLNARLKGTLAKALKAESFTGRADECVELLAPAGTTLSRILVFGAGEAAKVKAVDFERLGANVVTRLAGRPDKQASIVVGAMAGQISEGEMAAHVASGARLKSYRFDGYLTRLKPKDKRQLGRVTMMCSDAKSARQLWKRLAASGDGVKFALDLVNEPPNVLFPAAFAERARQLTEAGVKVEVLTVKEMRRLKMHALLGVGQGSTQEPRLVVMRWNGGMAKQKPGVFVGKGVTFDTGGISLKPPANMHEMKGDMAGAAAVTGLIYTLALRKARVNAVSVAVLAENMPDGNAQRPGDIVTSMSGQTIEILNTDAEGRLILADALWYAVDRFKPRFIVDLATLTGAILVALGSEYAGLFSNDDELSQKLTEAGTETGEKLWRFPLNDAYDRMIKSKIADMQNIGGRDAGSITAAQFLQRFVNKTPWAHLDIAGTAWKNEGKSGEGWATGFGVRLLDEFLRKNYEP